MTSRQVRRAAERAVRKQAQKAARETSSSSPTSEARAAMNRANAQHSTGPKTPEGRANSSRNSFKHGLCSRQLVLSTQDAVALDALKTDLRAEHQPANTAEDILVNELAEQFWRLRRARAAELTVLETEGRLSQLAAVHRMMSSAERGFHKALTTLRQLQRTVAPKMPKEPKTPRRPHILASFRKTLPPSQPSWSTMASFRKMLLPSHSINRTKLFLMR